MLRIIAMWSFAILMFFVHPGIGFLLGLAAWPISVGIFNAGSRTPEQEEAWKRYEEDTRTRRGLETI